jgi:hypothetical protein
MSVMNYPRYERRNIPFARNTLEVAALVTVLGFDLVRINLPCDIVFFNDDTVEINKRLGDHEEPAVGQTLCFGVVAVSLHTDPGEHLLRRPAKRIVPLTVGAV